MTSQAERSPSPLTWLQKFSYGLGDLGPAITANLLVFIFLPFLTDVAGISPGLAGQVLMIGKIWDAINDPIVGFLSDRTQSRWGRRHPWMIWGAIPFGLFFFLCWVVPPFGEWGTFWYYVVISIFFNLGYTMVNLPYVALTAELTPDYNERTTLNGFRFTFSIGGSIFSLILGLVLSLLIPDPELQHLVLAGLATVLSVIPIYLSIWGTRQPVKRIEQQRKSTHVEASIPLVDQIKIAFTNGPFLFVMGIYLSSWLAIQITATVLKYYVVSWMGLPDSFFFMAALAVQGTVLVMISGWSQVSYRLGKKAVYYLGAGFWLITELGLLMLQPGQVGSMFFLCIIAGFGVSVGYLIPWSMLPDVIDLDELKTGQRREGVFYSFMLVLQKMGLALGLALVGQILEWSGYQSTIAGSTAPIQPDSALLAIRLSITLLPLVCVILGGALAYFYPITQTVHQEILLKLEQNRESAKHQPPL